LPCCPQNIVLWLFLAVLLWTFRMRQGSPYLLMDDAVHETGGVVALVVGSGGWRRVVMAAAWC